MALPDDVRGDIPFVGNLFGEWGPKTSVTVHWAGTFVDDARDPLEQIISDAQFHVSKGWGGLSYHKAFARDGRVFFTRDLDAILAASGNVEGNRESEHWEVQTGPGQEMTPEQRASLLGHLAQDPRPKHPHSHWSATQCPGDAIRAALEEGPQDMTPQEVKAIVDAAIADYGRRLNDELNLDRRRIDEAEIRMQGIAKAAGGGQ